MTKSNKDETSLPIAAPSEEDVRAQLERILNSAALKGSLRRRNLLRYLVEETLAGRGALLKGYSVALAVLDRDDTFNPAADPVVRLEAGRLRRSLDSYYVNEGRLERFRISIPKGAYVADFTSWSPDIASADDDNGVDRSPSPTGPNGPEALETLSLPGLPAAQSFPSRTALIQGLVLGALFLAAVLGWFSYRKDFSDFAELHGSAIIVLPFEKLDPSDNTHLLANAITQDLIHDLMRFPDLRLFSAQESFGLDPGADPVALGRDLGVAFVLRGSVHSADGTIRLGAQLVDADSGEVNWSGSYDRVLNPHDLFAMRRDLSSEVATALGQMHGVVQAATSRRLAAAGAPGMESYSCVLRSFEYRRTYEDALFAPALACLRHAVGQDPDYAEAWAMLGWVEFEAARQDMVPPAEQPAHMKAAHEAAAQALLLDPDSTRGLMALAAITFTAGDFAQSEQLQRRALALNPHDPEVIAQLGWRLAVRGNWKEGIPLLNEAIERSIDPPGWYFHMISVHEYLEGNYENALAAAERSTKFGSAIGLSLAAISHAKLGEMDDARECLDAMAEAWPLLATDPAAAYRKFNPTDQIVEAMVAGLHEAGWSAKGEK